MALESYYDIYNLEGYKNRVSQLGLEIDLARSGDFVKVQKKRLKEQIKNLKQKEQKIFKLLNVKNIDELNTRLEEYKNAVVNFRGIGLKEEFISVLQAKSAEEYDLFAKATKEVLFDGILNEEAITELSENAYEKAMSLLNSELGRAGKHSSFKFKSQEGFRNQGVFPGQFTAHQKKRWKQLFQTEELKKYPKVKAYVDRYLDPSVDIEINSSSNDKIDYMSASFTWTSGTEGLTQTQAKERFARNSQDLKDINEAMTNFILSKAKSDHDLLRKIIEHILKEDPYAFFVGQNDKDITGLLGEISGLYYLSKLFGEFSQQVIKWRGGTHSGDKGQKPHQDILFDDLGVQVKNSVEDEIGTISFAEAGIGTMLNKAQLPKAIQNIFINYYGTQSFNVPYYKDGTSYVQGRPQSPSEKFEEFEQWSQRLGGYQATIDYLLSLSAAFFLYMDVYKNSNKMDANTLYLLGGTMFQTASNVLNEILKNIDQNESGFGIKASLKNTDINIVSALNNKLKEEDYSKFVSDNIRLKSSYNFGKLTRK